MFIYAISIILETILITKFCKIIINTSFKKIDRY